MFEHSNRRGMGAGSFMMEQMVDTVSRKAEQSGVLCVDDCCPREESRNQYRLYDQKIHLLKMPSTVESAAEQTTLIQSPRMHACVFRTTTRQPLLRPISNHELSSKKGMGTQNASILTRAPPTVGERSLSQPVFADHTGSCTTVGHSMPAT